MTLSTHNAEIPVTHPILQRFREFAPRKVWWILIVGALVRLTSFFFGENNGGDALARAAMTASWLQHPSFRLNFEPWLPIHFWLMAGASFLLKNVSLGARGLSLVLGIASLGIFWALAKEIYGKSAAAYSILVFALYSLHIGYSTTSSSEVPYLFFLLVGLACFFAYRRSGAFWLLGLSSIAMGVGAGIRYEAWVCTFAVMLILIFEPSDRLRGSFWKVRHFQEILLFGSLASLWPLFWMIYQWKHYAKPLYGVTMNYGWVATQIAFGQRSTLYRLALPPGVILLTLTPVILIAALYGLAYRLRERPGREFALIFSVSLVVFAAQITAGGLLPMARYTITLGTFLAIASGYGLQRLAASLRPQRAHQIGIAVGALLALNLAGILVISETRNPLRDKFSSISPLLRFPARIESLRQYLAPRLNASDAVVIDDYNVESNIVADAIGLPLNAGDRAFLASSQPLSRLSGYLRQRQPRYVILASRGVLTTQLSLPAVCPVSPVGLKGIEFRCVFKNDVYSVYSLDYGSSSALLRRER